VGWLTGFVCVPPLIQAAEGPRFELARQVLHPGKLRLPQGQVVLALDEQQPGQARAGRVVEQDADLRDLFFEDLDPVPEQRDDLVGVDYRQQR
jgi:hypothetical protein